MGETLALSPSGLLTQLENYFKIRPQFCDPIILPPLIYNPALPFDIGEDHVWLVPFTNLEGNRKRWNREIDDLARSDPNIVTEEIRPFDFINQRLFSRDPIGVRAGLIRFREEANESERGNFIRRVNLHFLPEEKHAKLSEQLWLAQKRGVHPTSLSMDNLKSLSKELSRKISILRSLGLTIYFEQFEDVVAQIGNVGVGQYLKQISEEIHTELS